MDLLLNMLMLICEYEFIFNLTQNFFFFELYFIKYLKNYILLTKCNYFLVDVYITTR